MADVPGNFQDSRSITVNTEGFGCDRDFSAVSGGDRVLFQQLTDTVADDLWAGDQRTRKLSAEQPAVGGVAAVSKEFLANDQSRLSGMLDQWAAGKCDEHCSGNCLLYGCNHKVRDGGLMCSEVVQGAVGFDVGERNVGVGSGGNGQLQLINQAVQQAFRRKLQFAATKAFAVGERRMGPERRTDFFTQTGDLHQASKTSGMAAAGDINGGDQWEQLVFKVFSGRIIVLAQITVEVSGDHVATPEGSGSRDLQGVQCPH